MCPLGTPVPRQLLGQVPSSSDTLPEIGVEFKERPSPRRIVMNFTPYLVAWAVIAAATITLLIYRAVVGAHEDVRSVCRPPLEMVAAQEIGLVSLRVQ